MKVITASMDKIFIDPSNERSHPEKNLEALKGSLKKFGQQKPIVVDSEGVILAGNGTYEAAKALGWKAINIVVSELKGVDKAGYRIADNRTSELADWDKDALEETLKALAEEEFDLSDIGFDIKDYDLGIPEKEGLTGDDDIPEVEENIFNVKRGDIWELGNHRLMCGDSTNKDDVEKLMDGAKADMVFTDPPYNVGFKYNSYDDDLSEDEYKEFCEKWFSNLKSVSSKICITPGTNNLPMWCIIDPVLQGIGCWVKKNWITSCKIANLQQWEPILFYGDFKRSRSSDIYEINMKYQKDVGDSHPCPKQIELLEDIFNSYAEETVFLEDIFNSYAEETVLDVFLGSGSTLIACEKTKRQCYGMEIDPHYCSVIIKRWQDYTGQNAVKIN